MVSTSFITKFQKSELATLEFSNIVERRALKARSLSISSVQMSSEKKIFQKMHLLSTKEPVETRVPSSLI